MTVQQPIDVTAIRERSDLALGTGRWTGHPAGLNVMPEHLLASARDVPVLLAEVEAQFSGEWRIETGFMTAGGFVPADDAITRQLVAEGLPVHQRRVWFGPVESFPADTTETTS